MKKKDSYWNNGFSWNYLFWQSIYLKIHILVTHTFFQKDEFIKKKNYTQRMCIISYSSASPQPLLSYHISFQPRPCYDMLFYPFTYITSLLSTSTPFIRLRASSQPFAIFVTKFTNPKFIDFSWSTLPPQTQPYCEHQAIDHNIKT